MTAALAILAQRMAAIAPTPAPSMVLAAMPAAPALTLTIAEAAAAVGVHPKTIRKWPLPWIVEGRTVRILRADLEEFLKQRGASTLPPS